MCVCLGVGVGVGVGRDWFRVLGGNSNVHHDNDSTQRRRQDSEARPRAWMDSRDLLCEAEQP